jgi:hypothetical protein
MFELSFRAIQQGAHIPSEPETPLGFTWNGCSLSPLEYQGCFLDRTSEHPDPLVWDPIRDLPLNKGSSKQMTPALCVAWCQAGNATRKQPFQYAGVQEGTFCLCGDSFGRYGPADNCTLPCPGDSQFKCGNHLQHDVYKVPVS